MNDSTPPPRWHDLMAAPAAPAQRVADALALARTLGCATDEVSARHLDEMARSAYARAAVWYGENAAVLADDAQDLFQEDQAEYDDQDGAEPAARPEFVRRAQEQLGRSGRPATEPADVHEDARVRALYLEILAGVMHAHQQIEGTHFDLYDAYEPFADLEQDRIR